MARYRVTLEVETPWNPRKWDWSELVASEEDEQVLGVTVERFHADADDSTEGEWA